MTRRLGGLVLGLVVATTLVVYASASGIGWVYEDLNWSASLDDHVAWSAVRIPGRGLTMTSLAWTGDDTATAHRVNVGLHVVTGLLVARVAWRLTGSVGIMVTAALIFLLHPLNSQAVLYLSARGDLLVALWILLAVWLALGPVTLWRWIVIPLALVAAAASKEVGLVAGGLLLLTLHLWRPRTPQTRLSTGWLLSALVAIGLTAVPFLQSVAGFAHQGFVAHGSGTSLPWVVFARVQMAGLWELLTLVVWPDGFTIDHDPLALSARWFRIAGLLTLQAGAIILATWRRAPMVAWALAWTLLAVAPRFVVPTEEFLAEQHLYLSMVGMSIGLAAGVRVVWLAACAEKGVWRAVTRKEGVL